MGRSGAYVWWLPTNRMGLSVAGTPPSPLTTRLLLLPAAARRAIRPDFEGAWWPLSPTLAPFSGWCLTACCMLPVLLLAVSLLPFLLLPLLLALLCGASASVEKKTGLQKKLMVLQGGGKGAGGKAGRGRGNDSV